MAGRRHAAPGDAAVDLQQDERAEVEGDGHAVDDDAAVRGRADDRADDGTRDDGAGTVDRACTPRRQDARAPTSDEPLLPHPPVRGGALPRDDWLRAVRAAHRPAARADDDAAG